MTVPGPTRTRWLRACNQVVRPRCRIVCAPHAGGTAQAYRGWPRGLPHDVEVHAVQYPGRQDRLAEDPVESMPEIVRSTADALEPFLGEPLVLFGHSMGAGVVYEVALELERRHGRPADLVIVSGSRAPHHRDPRDRDDLDDRTLIEEVRRLNRSFEELAAAPELLELVMPSIRADFKLAARYFRSPPVALRAPLLALGGIADPDVSPEDLAEWRACTTGRFAARTLPGDHFYLVDEGPVLDTIAPWLPGTRRTARGVA
ncbi:thioesterase II family protein [Kitasatospora sp. NPDC056184]|uniref:thioesterase II family protein n=1 Tax=Kitasatospora sp. NPDC056184 TaxID=3345738 RepID=UPI0035DED08D